MDGQYPPPIASLGTFHNGGDPLPIYHPDLCAPRLHQLQAVPTANLRTFPEYDNPHLLIFPPSQIKQRPTRRPPPGSDHVKHRRTRSGCYTCRQRRVKCDETHPICERCRKGKRECIYPGTTTSSSKAPRSNIKSKGFVHDSDSSPSLMEEEGADDKDSLHAILDEEDESEPQSSLSDLRETFDASFRDQSKTTSPTSESPSGVPYSPTIRRPHPPRSNSKHSVKASISNNVRWPSIPRDVQFYLRYHKSSISHHQYGMMYDGSNFLKTKFLEIAINDDSQALLYAIVAFASFHYAHREQDCRLSKFLHFYNTSITLLYRSLSKRKPDNATLLTILQLATIEKEFLGDRVNLLNHQRAAHQIITDRFTPETIMQDDTRRKIFNMYIRFDLFGGMMSQGEASLGREWFAAAAEFYARHAQEQPDDHGARFDEYFATSRLLAADVALLFATRTKNSMTDEEFLVEADQLLDQFANFGHRIQSAYTDPACFAKSFPNAPPPQEDDITDFRDPNFLYSGNLFTMNFVLMDFWAIELIFKSQLASVQQRPPPPEVEAIALQKAKLFEAIEYYDGSPPGAILDCRASLGIASLFIPKDERHTMWSRRKFALVEQNGYIYPSNLRKYMSDIWGIDVTRWWLPHDEGFSPALRAVREYVDSRSQASIPQPAHEMHSASAFAAYTAVDNQSIFDIACDTLTDDSNVFDTMGSWGRSPEQAYM